MNTMKQFTLQWDAFNQNIYNGLTFLQQNGELVDVTLAADGHLVRVHRLVLSLASPYLKELLASAVDCKHPVVFLSRVSFETLCSILEYMYTGQAMVSQDQLPELVQAAKELRIKGLEDMDVELKLGTNMPLSSHIEQTKKMKLQEKYKETEINPESGNSTHLSVSVEESHANIPHIRISKQKSSGTPTSSLPILDDDNSFAEQSDHHMFDNTVDTDTDQDSDWKCVKSTNSKDQCNVIKPEYSYSVSNQGGLQLILNRYIYNCRYTSTKGGNEGHRRWKCMSYGKTKSNCNAIVVTANDVIAKRIGVHNHPFHDKQILKKVQNNNVYATLKDVLSKTKNKQEEESKD